MFSRKELKERAKSVLKTNYWMTLAFVALISVAASALVAAVYVITLPTAIFMTVFSNSSGAASIVLPLITTGLAFVGTIFLMPFDIGLYKFLIKNSIGKNGELKDIIWGYKNNFSNTICTYFKIFFIILAFLLVPVAVLTIITVVVLTLMDFYSPAMNSNLVYYILYCIPFIIILIGAIPAMIKSYDYYLAGFILADEPELSGKEVLRRSKALMKGNRFAAFKLDLSFLGWALLGAFCCCGIGSIFLSPYIYQTHAELYLELSGKKQDSTVSDVNFEETAQSEAEENTQDENF